MSKNLNNSILILDGNRQLLLKSLNEGKIVEYAVENGPRIERALLKGFHDKFQTNIELASSTVPENSICGCGKPANIIIRCWK